MGSFYEFFAAERFEIHDFSRVSRSAASPGPSRAVAPGGDAFSLAAASLVERSRLEGELEKQKSAGGGGDDMARLAKQITPFVDALDRIVHMGRKHERAEELKPWIDGVDASLERLARTLERFDIRVDAETGVPVDLGRHEVLEYRPTKDHPHDTVVEVVQRGIFYKGRALRDARVVVACNPG